MCAHGLCLHEVDLANMAKDIEYIRESLDKINGLPVEVALHKQSISRLWWGVGIVAVAAIGALVKLIVSAIVSAPI
ncbi:MAG TPA: hypothetical protein ENI07_03700 [Desulfobacterales bacterium]|nr:hypothetical protein [Desulfobacterales bacterium]